MSTTTIKLQPADDTYKIVAVTSGLPSSGTDDPDLDAIASLDSTQAGVIASDGSGWIRKTYAQFKTSLSITKGDIALGNVDNTSDVLKPISDATQTALNGKQASATNLTSLAGIDATTAGTIANDGAGWIKKTYPQFKTALGVDQGSLDARYVRQSNLAINPVWPGFGADPTGATDSTAAIDTAAAVTGSIYFSDGTYQYNGSGLSNSNLHINGAGRERVTIALGSGKYLVQRSATIASLYVGNVRTSGGAGVVRMTFTSADVQGMYEVDRCRFDGYTNAAISHNSSDMPYWKIRHNIFQGANSTSTIGVALHGLTDGSSIDNNEFLLNRIHIKLGNGGNNCYITNNDLIQFGAPSGGARAAVWVVPHTSWNNSGGGLYIGPNKFGNENLATTDFRILYADEDTSGGEFGLNMPSLVTSAGYVTGQQVVGALFNGAGGNRSAIVSYTPNVRGCHFGPVSFGGTAPPYFLEFACSVGVDRSNTASVFGPFTMVDPDAALGGAFKVSNVPGVGYVIDPTSQLTRDGLGRLSEVGGSSATGYVKLLRTAIASFSLSSVTAIAATDSIGGADAVELTYSSGGIASATLTGLVVGQPVWVEFDVAPGSSSPLGELDVNIKTGTNFHFRRYVTAPTVWTVQRFLMYVRDASGTVTINFNSQGSTTGKIKLGRVRCYHAREPQAIDVQNQAAGIATAMAVALGGF